MAVKSTFTPKASLTEAPTNLKEAIDWVLRVTGRDGKALDEKNGDCICGLAAAVTDLLQSVELDYYGYQGDVKNGTDQNKGASEQQVKEHLNGLFSLVQGLGGTAVVRTYIDQLAQVLSALVGWSKIVKCKGKCNNGKEHGKNGCKYLKDLTPNDKSCDKCGCIKVEKDKYHLGKGCTMCDGDKCGPKAATGICECNCEPDGNACSPGDCKCNRKCGCTSGTYRSSYQNIHGSWIDGKVVATWAELKNDPPGIYHPRTITVKRHQCARILLGSVCLIWSGITYLFWTGRTTSGANRWTHRLIDGSGGAGEELCQWLQALGFPKDMLNDKEGNNLLLLWEGAFEQKIFLGFIDHSKLIYASDANGNTAHNPAGMNYPGFVHTIHRDSFNEQARVFPNGTSSSTAGDISENDKHKIGAIFKLYILSCAYFTGLQKRNSTALSSTASATNTPKTIREILYWLSALPYSEAYKGLLHYGKKRLTNVLKDNPEQQLSFKQDKRPAPITVHEYNLFAHFQAVTQYCPLVLIGIQGGIHSTNNTTPAIHALYANTECNFTYPTVPIQAYNQVVHYIRALFYQLYFLRKQCAVKVTCGGKWRECRYGQGVLGKNVVSWMCLGCNPMEHDRKWRVEKVKGELDALMKKVDKIKEKVPKNGEIPAAPRPGLNGNIKQELEEAIDGVKKALGTAKGELDGKVTEIQKQMHNVQTVTGDANAFVGAKKEVMKVQKGLEEALGGAQKKLRSAQEMIKTALGQLTGDNYGGLKKIVTKQFDIHKELSEILEQLEGITSELKKISSSPKCHNCDNHKDKCGQPPKPKQCPECLQQYMDGTPSPLQAFLEDRLPGFSCQEVPVDENPVYPPAASHLGHCGGSGQCCPLPMGFRGHFQEGITHTGQRLYGILYFFSNENMMQSCVYTLVRVTAELSATTPQVLGDVFGFFRGGVGNPEEDKEKKKGKCDHSTNPGEKGNDEQYFCGWCASGLRDEVKNIGWIHKVMGGDDYRTTVGTALINIKGDKDTGSTVPLSDSQSTPNNLSTLTDNNHYVSPLTGELYTAVSATFGRTYLSWVLYLSDALEGGLKSLASAFKDIECRGCKGQCDPNKCKKGSHGSTTGDTKSTPLCQCQSIVSCTGVLPVLYRHGFSYGNPFNLEGFQQSGKDKGDYSIQFNGKDGKEKNPKHCHEFLRSLQDVIQKKENAEKDPDQHPLTNLFSQVGKLQYDIRLPWIFVLTIAWLVAVLYLAFGAIWPLDWTHMRSHWLRGGEHQWQYMWYKVMTGRKGVELMEYFGRR